MMVKNEKGRFMNREFLVENSIGIPDIFEEDCPDILYGCKDPIVSIFQRPLIDSINFKLFGKSSRRRLIRR